MKHRHQVFQPDFQPKSSGCLTQVHYRRRGKAHGYSKQASCSLRAQSAL